MLLATKGLEESEIAQIATAVYAIARTVQSVRRHGMAARPDTLLRLYARGGVCNINMTLTSLRDAFKHVIFLLTFIFVMFVYLPNSDSFGVPIS